MGAASNVGAGLLLFRRRPHGIEVFLAHPGGPFWRDRDAGTIQSRMFAPGLGIREDEATGAAAVRLTEYLSRDLTIVQGHGSVIHTVWSPEGWVRVAGRVVEDGHRELA